MPDTDPVGAVGRNVVPGKRRKIIHLEEDGGCGHEWYTVEVPESIFEIDENRKIS